MKSGFRAFSLALALLLLAGIAAPLTRAEDLYGLAIMKISTRSGPSTKYEDTGTYDLQGQYLRILARAWDEVNEIWWVQCVIPENGRALWTGYKRFDHATLPLEAIPIQGSGSASGSDVQDDPGGDLYGLAIMKISTRSGPSTRYEDTGTYDLQGQYLRILARAWDEVNEIWWVQCVIPENERALWTGYKRFDHATLPLEAIPLQGSGSASGSDVQDDPGGDLYGLAIMKISTRSGPSTKYEDTGTYDLQGQYLKILARAWDEVNEIWWVQCVIPENGRALWTGYKRFDHATLPLEAIPIW